MTPPFRPPSKVPFPLPPAKTCAFTTRSFVPRTKRQDRRQTKLIKVVWNGGRQHLFTDMFIYALFSLYLFLLQYCKLPLVSLQPVRVEQKCQLPSTVPCSDIHAATSAFAAVAVLETHCHWTILIFHQVPRKTGSHNTQFNMFLIHRYIGVSSYKRDALYKKYYTLHKSQGCDYDIATQVRSINLWSIEIPPPEMEDHSPLSPNWRKLPSHKLPKA